MTRSVSIPRSEIELRFSRSSGPGGQHAQRTQTRVEALREALKVERPRRPTQPSVAARERRLEEKRRRAEVKRLRRAPPE